MAIRNLENSKAHNEFDNTKCTNNVTSMEQGMEWRVKNCLSDRLNQTIGTRGSSID